MLRDYCIQKTDKADPGWFFFMSVAVFHQKSENIWGMLGANVLSVDHFAKKLQQ